MQGSQPGRFRLMQYFMVTSLVAFTAVAIALYFLERAEQTFFEAAQREQNAFFAHAQADLVREQKAAARANLLAQHEAGHVSLAGLFANALWNAHFAPLVARTQAVPVDRCRDLGQGARDAAALATARQACYAELGKGIMALPGFAAADAAVRAMMAKTSVFKIKVYDLRGLTVYSSELPQIGEDKAENLGWMSAVNGTPASELVHRDRFSAFEGVVLNRDLIQSYVPVLAPGDNRIIGVFEIYSDVTPLLKQVEALSARIGEGAAANQARVEAAAQDNQRKVASNSAMHFAILAALIALLYVALLVMVRHGQRIIDEQAHAREQAALREQQWHREKMAALATMAANASHEIGNPVAVVEELAEEIERAQAAGQPLADQPRRILEQTSRIAEMTRHITEFATVRSETSELLDVNRMVRAVGDFLSFDSRYRATPIDVRLAERLPACVGIPEHLNEVLMSLMQAHAEARIDGAAPGGRLLVQTEARGEEVVIRIACDPGGPGQGALLAGSDWRLESARRRIEGMGGRLVSSGATTEIFLECAPSGDAAA